MPNLVSVENGVVTVDSKMVADAFGKIHRDVLRSIKNLECSDDFRARNFAHSSYTSEQGKTLPCVSMTRDGFCFLAMGFTGAKAGHWKESFLSAFNSMESAIESQKIGPMQILSDAVHAFEQDSKNASLVGQALSAWKKVKAQHIQRIFEANSKAQMLIEFENKEVKP